MAMTLDSDTAQVRRRDEIEAVLDAMEDAAPGAKAEHLTGVYVLNRPIVMHQRAVLRLATSLLPELPDDLEPLPEIRVSDGETWIVPDLVVVSADIDGATALLEPSDVVVMIEVESSSTAANDHGPKRAFCERHGIDYWIVTPTTGGWVPIEQHPYGGGSITPPSPPS